MAEKMVRSPFKLHALGYGTCKSDSCEFGMNRERVPPELWVPGDGNWQCPRCGYGIAPAEAPAGHDIREAFSGQVLSWTHAMPGL